MQIADDRLHKVAYARLVRKGGADVTNVHGPVAGYTVRSAMNNSTTPCHGAFVGYDLAFSSLGVTPRVSACHSSFSNATLAADVDELGIDLRVYRAWDLPIVTVDLLVSPWGPQRRRYASTLPSESIGETKVPESPPPIVRPSASIKC